MDTTVAAESARPAGLTANRVAENAPAGRPNCATQAVPFPSAGRVTVAVEISTVWPALLWNTPKTIPMEAPFAVFV
jgi:hypothetical protein